mmetsp:Transcript_7957/g.13209  ORF Transcript_7957/g.13209 Transcript_7957/m.13209 type:complete len:210 (-) Transcript_7957:991-1620(-)
MRVLVFFITALVQLLPAVSFLPPGRAGKCAISHAGAGLLSATTDVTPADAHRLDSQMLLKKVGISFVASIMIATSFSSNTLAAVGEGDLPPGSMAFSKLLKYQTDWKKLSDTIKSRSNEMSEQEVLGIKSFLKSLANEYSDMDLLSTGITDKEKAQEARNTAKEFRKVIRACDDAASDNNLAKITELYPESSNLLNKYLGFLQDVPDEL